MGITTHMLSSRCAEVIGLDKAQDRLALARAAYPTVRFEQLDIFDDDTKLELLGAGFNVVLIDINGSD